MIQKNCIGCGVSFDSFPSEQKVFCSRRCYVTNAKMTALRGEKVHNFISDVTPFTVDTELKAYFIGFLQSDGWIQPKRIGMLLKAQDAHILETFRDSFGGSIRYQTRNTNFIQGWKGVEWSLNNVRMIRELHLIGFPIGAKSKICTPITVPPDLEHHYVRGLMDGDGSLCFAKGGWPLFSFTTGSPDMALYFQNWLHRLSIPLEFTPRNTVSLTITRDKAKKAVQESYKDASVYLERKYVIAQRILGWTNPVKR
jgi:hypothetical protein